MSREKKTRKWKEEMNEAVIEMGKAGDSFAQIASKLGVSRQSIYNWQKDSRCPGFKAAMQRARTEAEAFLMDVGLRGMTGQIKGFNQVTWIYTMKCRFRDNWHDSIKSEVKVTSEHEDLTDEQIKALIHTKIADEKKKKEIEDGE